jgi:NADPH:quinone reductase-like Zn-dependent oxidoreductase
MMKAVECTRYGPPDVLQLREVEKPTPKNNEVLIRVHAATVTTGDCEFRSLKNSSNLEAAYPNRIWFQTTQKEDTGARASRGN